MAVLGLGWFTYALEAGVAVEHARNSLLLLMVLMQNVDALNARSETVPVLRLRFRANPLLICGIAAALLLHVVAMHAGWLQRTIDVAPVSAREWLVLPLLAVSLFVVMETQKAWRRRGAPGNTR
jgi:magnesium-transporting ATPase (P-type)